jgi:Domain of unknown function (DUF4833)
MRRWFPGALVLGVATTVTCQAAAEEVPMGPNDVPTVFFISKSDDHNRVDYGIRLDASCAPINDAAVFPYWREFEKAPPVRTHAIGALEVPAYGIAEQRLVQKAPDGAVYTVKLRALPRVITLTTSRGPDGKCVAVARTLVGGRHAVLLSAYVKLGGAFSIEYVDLHGTKPDGGPVEERLRR